jgi:hypothetical protein
MEILVVRRNDPRSRIRLVRDSCGMLLDLARIRFNRRTGRHGLGQISSTSTPDHQR